MLRSIFKWTVLATCLITHGLTGIAQQALTRADFELVSNYFRLSENHTLNGQSKELFLSLIDENQFVGIAEVHQSRELSYFTTGFLEILSEKGFQHFALEIGPYSANILQELSANPVSTSRNLNTLNRTYGKKSFPKIPIVFVDKVEDALFVEKASELEYEFWGLDQEFAYSYEMHLDNLFKMAENPDPELTELYQKCKELIRSNIFKEKVQGTPKNCWFKNEPTFGQFFDKFGNQPKAKGLIDALHTTWDIYCRNESNQPSNQIRADYMKNNFDSLYNRADQIKNNPRVFVKLGGVHLTKGKSIFNVRDLGEHLEKKADENGTGFLAIRHLSRYRDGKDVTGKKGWEGLELIMQMGKKDEWTLIDLRPLRKKLESIEVQTSKDIAWEIRNYDLILIPPDDKKSALNY